MKDGGQPRAKPHLPSIMLSARMYVQSVRVWNSTYEAKSNFIKFSKTESMFEINKKNTKFFPRIYVY